jgi:hypothetical protein
MTPTDLMEWFPLKTGAAAVVRDYDSSERAGLVVFANEGDSDVAIGTPPCPFYRACIKVSCPVQLMMRFRFEQWRHLSIQQFSGERSAESPMGAC